MNFSTFNKTYSQKQFIKFQSYFISNHVYTINRNAINFSHVQQNLFEKTVYKFHSYFISNLVELTERFSQFDVFITYYYSIKHKQSILFIEAPKPRAWVFQYPIKQKNIILSCYLLGVQGKWNFFLHRAQSKLLEMQENVIKNLDSLLIRLRDMRDDD